MEKIERLIEIVKYAKKHIPFYQRIYADIDVTRIRTLEDFKRLPLVKPNDLLIHSEELRGTDIKPYRVTSSSGTIEKPKIIYRLREDTRIGVAVLKEMLMMANVDQEDVVLIGQPFDMAHFGYLVAGGCEELKSMAIPAGISMTNEKYVSLIQRFRPSVICSSPSRVLAIIKLLLEKNVKEIPYVKTIILAGEPLNRSCADKIAAYFHSLPYNFYGSEETDGLAGDCSHHKGLHFYDDYFYLELMDITGIKPSSTDNRVGEAVITSLYQKGVPLIRYCLGDIIEVENSPCACGSSKPLIYVYGRTGDSFNIFDGITIMAYQIEAVITRFFNDMINYQVVISSLVPGFEEILIRIERKDQQGIYDEQALIDSLWELSEDMSGIRATGHLQFRVAINDGKINVTQRGKTKKIIDLRNYEENR